jgi:hypothetical protein
MEKTDSHNSPRRDRAFRINQVAITRTASRTKISKYSSDMDRGSGVMGVGTVYPDSNSGLGNRCCAKTTGEIKMITRIIDILFHFFILRFCS